MRCQSEVGGGTGHQKRVEGWGEMGQANEEYPFLALGKQDRVVSCFVRDRQGLCWRWTAEGRECGGRHAAIPNDHK